MALALKRYFFSFVQKTIEFSGRSEKNGVSVLMFHQVNDDRTKWNNQGIAITLESFKSLILSLKDRGCSFISVGEIEENLDGKKKIAVTFDDVFGDTMTDAIPFLKEHDIPFCIFIADCFIDKEKYITTEQLLDLASDPLCTVGYHTKSHAMLRSMNKDEALKEIDCSELQKKINKKIDYLAYPYGSVYACGSRKASVSKGRYKLSFSTVSVKCTEKRFRKHPYYLPRINVNESNHLRVSEQCG